MRYQRLSQEDADRRIDAVRDPFLRYLRQVEHLTERLGNYVTQPSLAGSSLLPIERVVVFDEDQAYRQLPDRVSRQQVAESVQAFDHLEGGAPNRSVRCLAAVAAPLYVVDHINELNLAKDLLKRALEPIAQFRLRSPVGSDEARTKDWNKLTSLLLRRLGLSHLNLLALYRHVPVVERAPKRVQFMLTRTRSVERLNAMDIARRVSGQANEAEVLRVLSQFPNDEPFAAPKARYERMRAKVTYRSPDPAPRYHIIAAELPIFIAQRNAREPWPEVIAPNQSTSPRGKRPGELEEEPIFYLGTQPVHRFLSAFRDKRR